MKRITNILSYLCLLLLLIVVACSDLEEITIAMQGEEEVELTIQTNIPSLGGSTRTAPPEKITSITALAFDGDHELIKVVTEGVIQKTETDSTGTFKVKVPLRTRRIHFIAKNNGVFDDITDDYYGQTDVSLLVDRTATDEDLLNNALHYWAMLDFDNAADLNDLTDELASAPNKDGKLTLIRNMAKLILDTPGENDCIVGFMNYNTNGTLVPYIENGEKVEFCYQTVTNHKLPNRPIIIPVSVEKDLGKVHYMFEEYNDVGDLVYVICKLEISTDTYKYFKFALKKDTSTYYYIVRNCKYRIKIDDVSKISASGHDTYGEAVANVPINADTEEVNILFEPNPLSMFLKETGEVTVTIPKGITTFSVGYMKNYFIQGGVACTYEPTQSEVTTGDGKELWVDTYTVSGENDEEIVFTIELKEVVVNTGEAVSGIEIQFQGNGPGKTANKILTVNALLQGSLTVTPTTVEMVNRADTECMVTVKIESYDYNVGDYKLQVGNANGVFAVTAPAGLDLHDDGYYYATKGQSYTFTFTLIEAGTAGAEHKIDFDLFTDYHHLEGTTTVTLVEPTAYDTYELWFDNNTKVNGSTDYNYFFDWGETEGITISSSNNLESTSFYDDGANTHRAQAMVMGQDNSISFTIGATRYLTLLVANDGDDSDTPSIQLSNGSSWTTGGDTEDLANGTYNFAAEGEITSAGRLIRYKLEPGTYTLQGSDAADYLLYYMRVSTTKPTMTDIVTDATASNYTLAWSGGEYGQYIKVENSQTADYVVDEDATTFTPTLNYSGLNLTNVTLVVNTDTYLFTDRDENISGTVVTYTQENGTYPEQSIPVKLADNLTAGVYTLSGKAEVSEAYKYAAFYDYAQLNAVGFTVKNTIKVGLYYNWYDGAVWNYIDGYNDNGDRMNFFLGLKTPYYTLPVSVDTNSQTVTPINFTLSDDWVRTNSGLGIDDSNAPAYRLVTQYTNSENTISRTHPQTKNYVYRIQWRDVAAESIKVSTTDTDVYFSGKGIDGNNVIGKEITIATPITNDNLEINLDFSADVYNNLEVTEAENRSNNVYNDLQLGTSRFYLTATISYQDSKNYNGQSIQLIGRYPSVNGGANGLAIDWDGSSQGGSTIVCSTNGEYTTLKFNVVEGTTEYRIAWEFVPGQYYQGGDINFDYVISNADGNSYIITGDTQATIGFTNEPTSNGQIQVAANGSAASNSITMPLEYGANSTEEFTVDVTVPAGVTQINIEAEDFDIAWGDMDNSNTNISSHTFSSSSDSQTTRFKFTLKDSSNTENSSTITFSDNSGSATSATITVDLSPRTSEPSGGTTIWNGMMDLSWDYALNYLSVKDQIPTGSVVTLNFTTTTGGAFKLHDKDGGVDAIVLPNISYGDNPGVISVNSGQTSYSFTVTNDIIVNNQNISEYIDGLKINGDNVRMTSIVVKYPVIYCNFDNDIEGFYVSGKGSVERVDNALALISDYNETDEPWAAQAMKTTDKIEYGATYTLTFKAKIANGTTGEMAVAIQRFENGECVATDHYRIFTINDINNAEKDNQDWAEFTYDITIHDNNQETPNENNPTHFMFNFGDINGTVYIDDLKLVKKNQ